MDDDVTTVLEIVGNTGATVSCPLVSVVGVFSGDSTGGEDTADAVTVTVTVG